MNSFNCVEVVHKLDVKTIVMDPKSSEFFIILILGLMVCVKAQLNRTGTLGIVTTVSESYDQLFSLKTRLNTL